MRPYPLSKSLPKSSISLFLLFISAFAAIYYIWLPKMEAEDISGASFFKDNNPSIWNISEVLQKRWPNSFSDCLNSKDISALYHTKSHTPYYSAIVQSIDFDRVDMEFDYSSNLMNCYCKKFGCGYISNPLDSSKIPKASHFYMGRWISMRDRHWHKGQWIFGADTDLVPVDFSRDYQKYLRVLEGRATVILHARRNHEVTASFVGFKTADRFAQCFHQHWISLGSIQGHNFDNGDLLQAILEIAAPDLYDRCVAFRNTDYAKFVNCFAEVYSIFMKAEKESNGTAVGPHGLPIKIYMPLEGMWRSYEGPVDTNSIWYPHGGYFNLLESDVFVHGYKGMGKFFGDQLDAYSCKLGKLRRLGPKKVWWGPEQTLQFARKCCYVKYRGCTVADAHSGVINICEQSKCSKLLYNGEIGAGYC